MPGEHKNIARIHKTMVPTAGLEPAQVAPLAPQASASTNFATSADHELRSTFQRGSPTYQRGSRANPENYAALRADKTKIKTKNFSGE
jgi:hypothetical protein